MRLTYFFFVALLIGCTASQPSMYKRLGEREGIAAIVDTFIKSCATDPRIAGFFVATSANRARHDAFRENLIDQLCEAADGPCTYTGKSMHEAHKGMTITDTHFDALVEDLSKSLDKHRVLESDKKQLLGILSPMRTEIVRSDRAGASAH